MIVLQSYQHEASLEDFSEITESSSDECMHIYRGIQSLFKNVLNVFLYNQYSSNA